MVEPVPVDIFAMVTEGELMIVAVAYAGVGAVCAVIGATVAGTRGRSGAGCAVLCFVLGPIGIGLVMAMPLSTSMRLQEESDWHRRYGDVQAPAREGRSGSGASAQRLQARRNPVTEMLSKQRRANRKRGAAEQRPEKQDERSGVGS